MGGGGLFMNRQGYRPIERSERFNEVSRAYNGWGPGARLRATVGVQGAEPPDALERI